MHIVFSFLTNRGGMFGFRFSFIAADYPEEDIQVGYKLKGEADDEDVTVAVRPAGDFLSKIQGFFKR